MKKLFTILLVMTFAATAFAGIGLAQGPQGHMGSTGPRYDGDRNYEDGYNRVELNEEQINEIADLREEFYNETEELRDQLRDLNRKRRDLEFRGADYSEIGKVEDKIENVLSQLEQKRIDHQDKIESVMTEEQLERIEENRLNSEERYQNRFDRDYRSSYGPRSGQFGRGRSSFGRGRHHGFAYDGYGMMGRFNAGFDRGGYGMMGFNSDFGYRQNRSNRSFGPGAGWCY